MQACRYGRVQHLEHLLYYGAEIDVQNASGNTPLHVCAAYNQVIDDLTGRVSSALKLYHGWWRLTNEKKTVL